MPEFTANQQDAISYRAQDACVVAGPGSGKTTVLVERYRSLVEDYHFDPRHILAITFTEKAAANMKAKLAELFAQQPLRLHELESAYVSTIHGFCARLLRENAIAAGIDPRFSVLDARESEELQFSCLHAALDELVEQRCADALQLIQVLHKPDLAADLRNAWDAIRSAGLSTAGVRSMPNPGVPFHPRETAAQLRRLVAAWVNPTVARQAQRAELLDWAQRLEESDGSNPGAFAGLIRAFPRNNTKAAEITAFKENLQQLLAAAADCHTARFRAMIYDVLARFEQLYAERKTALAGVDFNDLERRAIDLLRKNPDVCERVRRQFRQVMLDEFQDINEQQSELIRLVRGEDVFFAVGDINQSIYGFRHARPEIFEDYRDQIRQSSKHAADLLHNFRSRPEILRCVELLLNAAEGIEPRDLIAGSSFPGKIQPSIEVLKVHDADKDEAAVREARWIAHRILALQGKLQVGANSTIHTAEFRDFAVLCRNSESMRPILEGFNHANIPYVCGRRQSFLLSREGLDITCMLRIIANPRDSISLAAVLRSPLAAIGDEALLRIRLLANSLPGGLNVLAHDHSKLAEFEGPDARKIERFVANLKRWRSAQPVTPLEILIVRALSDCSFQWLPGTVAAANIESFLQLARTRGANRSLNDFLREIESIEKADSLESELSDADQGDCVQVMTAHAAKGLEFPVTIIAAMDKGTQRNSAPATFTPEFGLGLKWKEPDGKAGNNGIDDSWQWRNSEHLKQREKREANRLLYVAMTRAEEHLILSYSRGKNRSSHWARIVDDAFQLEPRAPAAEPEIETISARNGDSFNVTIRIVDADPPLLTASVADPAAREGVLTIPRPTLEAQHDSGISVTSLTAFADCPQKYYLQRYLGWNRNTLSKFDPEELPGEDDTEELSAADLGSLVHEILAGKPGDYPPEARSLADVFVASDLGRRAAAAIRSGREWDFIADINGTLVRGTVDLWFEEAGGIVVVDYKSDAQPHPEAYAPQLALYARALERAIGRRPAEAWLYFLRSNMPIRVPVGDAAIHRVDDLLAELSRAQDELRFDLRPGERCRACQFHRNLCPAQ